MIAVAGLLLWPMREIALTANYAGRAWRNKCPYLGVA
jgi:hypothetical protein